MRIYKRIYLKSDIFKKNRIFSYRDKINIKRILKIYIKFKKNLCNFIKLIKNLIQLELRKWELSSKNYKSNNKKYYKWNKKQESVHTRKKNRKKIKFHFQKYQK